MSKALTIDVQALHEWALENEFDPNHYSLNKLIELYDLSKQLKKIAEDDGCYGEYTHPKQYVDDNTSYVPHPEDEDYYDIHDTMDTTKLAKEIINGNKKTN
jgi:hypothetical protein